MAMGGVMLVKHILMIITGLSFLSGIFLIGGGSYLLAKSNLATVSVNSLAGGAVVIGLFIVITSFLGCLGTAKNKGVLLKTYLICLSVLIICELGVGISAYQLGTSNNIQNTLENTWRQLYASDPVKNIKPIQDQFRCCGYLNKTDAAVPGNCAVITRNDMPCMFALLHMLQSNVRIIGGAGVGLAILQILCLLFSVFLFIKLSKGESIAATLQSENWRMNRNKVQHGYSNYQFS